MRKRLSLLSVVAVLLLSACSSSTDAEAQRVQVPIFAAASLTEVFTDLEPQFEAANPELDLVFNFAGSPQLLSQMQAGANFAVFAPANLEVMEQAQAAELVQSEEIFAANTLALAINPNYAQQVQELADLAKYPELKIVRCAAQVPCGKLTDEVLAAIGVKLSFATEQNSVTDVLGLVLAGQADAAFVYQSDLNSSVATTQNSANSSSSKVELKAIELTAAAKFVQEYPIALATAEQSGVSAAQLNAGDEFINFLQSETAQQALTAAGFLRAPKG